MTTLRSSIHGCSMAHTEYFAYYIVHIAYMHACVCKRVFMSVLVHTCIHALSHTFKKIPWHMQIHASVSA